MSGETSLSTLLRLMEPVRHSDEYVFCSADEKSLNLESVNPICLFREPEGLTLILTQAEADQCNLPYTLKFCMITLSIHSSLEAVGFLAAITDKLAKRGISVNPVSAYYHDHLFIPLEKADEAMSLLHEFSKIEETYNND